MHLKMRRLEGYVPELVLLASSSHNHAFQKQKHCSRILISPAASATKASQLRFTIIMKFITYVLLSTTAYLAALTNASPTQVKMPSQARLAHGIDITVHVDVAGQGVGAYYGSCPHSLPGSSGYTLEDERSEGEFSTCYYKGYLHQFCIYVRFADPSSLHRNQGSVRCTYVVRVHLLVFSSAHQNLKLAERQVGGSKGRRAFERQLPRKPLNKFLHSALRSNSNLQILKMVPIRVFRKC
jgi:hypothetical protein